MTSYDYDLFTIGAGSGGVRACRVAAGYGARVGVAEERYLGGTCVNVGCVPKKLLVHAAHLREEMHDGAGFGWTIEDPSFDWQTLVANKNTEIARLNGIYRSLLEGSGVELHESRARLLDAHTVEVGGRAVTAEHILIATGGWPFLPKTPGIENAITSNEAFFLETLPERVVIVGGGYVAVEFAGIFNGLGSQTTLLYRGPLFLRHFDRDLAMALAEEMRAKGVDICFETEVRSLSRSSEGGEITVVCDDLETLSADVVLYATGRRPSTAGLGLEEIGVETDAHGAIVVDDLNRSSVPSIWAIGDVTQRGFELTPVAIREGMALARTLFGGKPTRPDYDNIPTAVFSQPPVGTVGLSEREARDRFGDIDVYRTRFRALEHTLTDNTQRTLMKLVVERSSQRVVGAHMVGPHAGEIIQGIAIAVKMGATKAQFDATIGIHPTSAEEFVTMRDPVSEEDLEPGGPR